MVVMGDVVVAVDVVVLLCMRFACRLCVKGSV